MIEGVHADAGIVGAGEECVAGAEAGAKDAEVLVPLLLEPIETAADIDDRLAAGGDGAPDVRTDGVIGSLDFCGSADIVIRH